MDQISINRPINYLACREAYFNNFEISSFAMWRSKEYRMFYDFLEDSAGFWIHRWGDSPGSITQ